MHNIEPVSRLVFIYVINFVCVRLLVFWDYFCFRFFKMKIGRPKENGIPVTWLKLKGYKGNFGVD